MTVEVSGTQSSKSDNDTVWGELLFTYSNDELDRSDLTPQSGARGTRD